VATRVGGVAEIVTAEETGLLAPAANDAELADHVLRLADDAALARCMGQKGHERARLIFSESQMHARYLAVYRDMLRS
jgi:glycosyltransferase involved in cell wall biosynthesis